MMQDYSKIFKAKKPKPGDYLRVVTDAEKAEMYLYGYIGQDFWWDEDMNEESITDLAFIKEFRKLEKQYKEIHIRINSPGGSVFHGDAIISAIAASDAEIHTHNDGMAASMGFDIWLAGDVRHMSKNAKGMVHATMSYAFGNAANLREQADMLDLFDEVAIGMFAERTGLPAEEVRATYYDGKDHWMTARQAAEMGLIESEEPEEAPEEMEDADRMTHTELIHRFHGAEVVVYKTEKPKEEKSKSLRLMAMKNRAKELI